MKFSNALKNKDINESTEPKGKSAEQIIKETELLDSLISEDIKNKLETLAGVTETSYEYTERGIKFGFNNSQRANKCQIIKYHDKIIVEFRKESDNILEGSYNKLVSENIIDIADFAHFFEDQTGIYLSYI